MLGFGTVDASVVWAKAGQEGGKACPVGERKEMGDTEVTLQRTFAVKGSRERWLQLSRNLGPGGRIFSSWQLPERECGREGEMGVERGPAHAAVRCRCRVTGSWVV